MNEPDPNPEYWSEYSNLQHVKHALIKHYLDGWFPKMLMGERGCRRLLYVDTHAGRGKHLSGQLGSPLVALTTLLNHMARDRMLANADVHYYFIERDEENVAALKQELNKYPLPPKVTTDADSGDCFQIIDGAIAGFEKDGKRMAPGFFFVDPYGFKLPGKLLRKLLGYPRVELFVNVIWRELDMAMRLVKSEAEPMPEPQPRRAPFQYDLFGEPIDTSPSPDELRRLERARAATEAMKVTMRETLDSVFGGEGWRKIDAAEADDRADQCAALFREITGARWGTHLRMRDNGRVRYFLLHLTNHPEGRDLMKECMWKVCPDGGFYASKSDSPNQIILIEPEPDLKPLREWVSERLKAGPRRWQDLTNDLREELWMGKHLNMVVRDMNKAGRLVGSEHTGQFAQKNNPLLTLMARPQLT